MQPYINTIELYIPCLLGHTLRVERCFIFILWFIWSISICTIHKSIYYTIFVNKLCLSFVWIPFHVSCKNTRLRSHYIQRPINFILNSQGANYIPSLLKAGCWCRSKMQIFSVLIRFMGNFMENLRSNKIMKNYILVRSTCL